MLNRQQKIRIAKARSYVNRMANGNWLSQRALEYTMAVADEFGDDAIWQQS